MSNDRGIDFLDLLRLVKKRWYLFLICAVVFTLFGIYQSSQQPGYYSSTLFIASTATNGTQIEKVVAHLIELRLKGGPKQFSEKLGIGEEAGASLKTLAYKNPKSDNEFKVYTAEIEMQLFNNKHIPELSEGIISYIKNNEFLSRQTTAIRKDIDEYLSESRQMLQTSDSLQKGIMKGRISPSSEAINLAGDMGELRSNMLMYQIVKERTNVVDLVAEPVIPINTSGPDSLLIISGSFLSSLLFAAILSAGLEIWKKL